MPHYYDSDNRSEKFFTIRFRSRNREFVALSSGAVFSKDGLDRGTSLLIEVADISNGDKVCDLGCGWGPVTLVLKDFFPDSEFVMIDVNPQALLLARKNLAGRDGVRIVKSDVFSSVDEFFDVILTNPPYAAGRSKCYEFITQSFAHLRKGGSLQLVARHNKGGAMLEKKMNEVFGNVSVLGKKGGFRVYKSVKE